MPPSTLHPTQAKAKRALLVGVFHELKDRDQAQSLLDELSELVANLGIVVELSELVHVRTVSPRLLLGVGKAEEVILKAKSLHCDLIIFDAPLSPGQQRNWEKTSQLAVIDRSQVILDIFATRAQTREAVLQVELARLEYYLPRLTRGWTHLSRQRGGGVTQRGDGETQLEIDQRLIRDRIAQVRSELSGVIRHRQVQRKRRIRIPVPCASIVGYTNAGKSSLLNALTGACVVAKDQLFATLDPTTRKLKLPSGQTVLLTDTVGFIRRLPHRLIEAFKATLEEAIVADFLIHVIDLSSPECEAHVLTTREVLAELGAADKPTLTVLNKVDKPVDPILRKTVHALCPGAIEVSLVTGQGLGELTGRISDLVCSTAQPLRVCIPHDQYTWVRHIHEHCSIVAEAAHPEGVYFDLVVPARWVAALRPFEVQHFPPPL